MARNEAAGDLACPQTRQAPDDRLHQCHCLRRQKSHGHAAESQDGHGRQHGPASFVPVPGLVSARLSQENDAERLGKAGRGQAPDHGQPRDRGGPPDGDTRQADAFKSADVNEEFTHEPVQRRQAADGHGPGEKQGCSPRHPSYESAQVVDIPRAGRMDHATCAQGTAAL